MAMFPPVQSGAGSSACSENEDADVQISQPAPDPDPAPTPAKTKKKPPQEVIDEFWSKFTTGHPGKATTVIPKYKHAKIKAVARSIARETGAAAQASYEQAAALCRAKVEKIVLECRRVNKKYRDLHFDLEWDLKLNRRECLQSIANAPNRPDPGSEFEPMSVKRVPDIFDRPQFYVDGPTAHDVRQGRDGDCWLMAALCTLSNKAGLIERVCAAKDEAVGVYGFVFYRDGAWISEIIDDQLYLTKADYDESHQERILWDDRDRVNSEEAYRRTYQTNSGALYFAQSSNPNETWLPLLEKCYAKAHGDYAAIEGGFGGEAIEDMTGGITTELYTADILDKEHFWKELLQANSEFLFGCSTGVWPFGCQWGDRRGIIEKHAYSVMRTVEMEGERLVMLRNPWGKGEWTGPWSDGSKQWTPEWMQRLDHKFGDDGAFWISYADLLRKYQVFERTRLFGPEWRIASEWTTLNVPWTLEYHDTYFTLDLAEPGPVVIVLSQLDDRYFRGLEGQYEFRLAFRVHRHGKESYLVRTETPLRMSRSVNVDLELDRGRYDIRIKVEARRDEDILPVEEIIRLNAKPRRDKLMRIGLAYDIAHSKGKVVETPAEKAAREAYEKSKREREKGTLRRRFLKGREQAYYMKTKEHKRNQKRFLKDRAKRKAKQEKKRAAAAAAAVAGDAPKNKEAGDASEEKQAEEKQAEEVKVKEQQSEEPKVDDGDGGQGKETTHSGVHVEEEAGAKPKPEKQQEEEKEEKEEEEPKAEGTRQKQVTIQEPAEAELEPELAAAAERVIIPQDTPATAYSWGTPAATPRTPFTPATDMMSPDPDPVAAAGGAKKAADTAGEAAAAAETGAQQGKDSSSFSSSKGLGLLNIAVDGTGNEAVEADDEEQKRQRQKDSIPGEDPIKHPDEVGADPTQPSGIHRAKTWPQTHEEQQEGGNDVSDSESDLSDLSDLSELSQRELDIMTGAARLDDEADEAEAAAKAGEVDPKGLEQAPPKESGEDPDEFEASPWNAVVVVGLRVYYKAVEGGSKDQDKDAVVKLEVVRPNAYEDYDEKAPQDSGSRGLDVDDSAKDGTLEIKGPDRLESIVPDGVMPDGTVPEGAVSDGAVPEV